MPLWLNRIALTLPILTLLSGCQGLGNHRSPAEPRAELDHYRLSEAQARSSTGCEIRYRIYAPEKPASLTSVMLGHGFLRNQNRLVNLSRALANSGIPAITLDFCNMRPWNGNHMQNAADMRDLASTLGIQEDMIYAGFSAGALAAVLAADSSTRAILTLDLVDQADLGLAAIQQVNVPLIGLHAPSSKCNARNNGLVLFTAREGPIHSKSHLIAEASHCEFESPSNWLCEISCGDKNEEETDEVTRQRVINKALDMIRPYLTPSTGQRNNPKPS